MSGGVDSSVAAAFLKNKGLDVHGITIRFSDEKNRCCSDQDLRDAKTVASLLGIPHTTVDLHTPFDQNVIRYFVSEYLKGRTPNPCAVCNPAIKFGALYDRAALLGAGLLATGHYARIAQDPACGRVLLRRGKERGKDQSYFLARLEQEALSRVLFPIGSYTKKKIRALAKKWGLPVADKTESQEVCFIPDGRIAGFIERYSRKKPVPGPIVDTQGNQLGTHTGIIGYTIGQRKGLGIAVGKPVYVTHIDPGSNTLVVGDHEDLYQKSCLCSDPNWIMVEDLRTPMQVKARIRYQHHPASAEIVPLSRNKIRLDFEKPQRALTPGQLAVFYSEESVVGSAWIDEALD